MNTTYFVCIGSTKCGTGWLHSQLKRHPDIHFPPGKEIHYWEWIRYPYVADTSISARLAQLELPGASAIAKLGSLVSPRLRRVSESMLLYKRMLKARYTNDHSAYVDYMNLDRGGERVIGDITPNYTLLNRRSFSEMCELFSEIKILFVMRDPIERLWSSVKFENRNVDLPFEKKLEYLHFRFREASSNPDDLLHRKSRYEKTIAELEASVPQSAILYMFYEDIFYRREFSRFFDFLGLDPIEMNFVTRINEGSSTFTKPCASDWANAIDFFSPTYETIKAHWGDRIPAEWHR